MTDLNTLLSALQGSSAMEPPQPKAEVELFAENILSERVPLKSMPRYLTQILNKLASSLIDPHPAREVVVGYPFTGKTFAIEQLVLNMEEYLSRTSLEAMHFISLSELQMVELGSVRKLKNHAQEMRRRYNAKDEHLCFVTDNPEVALYLSSVLPKSNIILEMNVNTLESILHSSGLSRSKFWASWNILDVNKVFTSRDELTELLWQSIVARFNESYNEKLSKKQVRQFIDRSILAMPNIEQEDETGEKLIAVPPGIWAVCIKQVFGLINFDTEHNFRDSVGRLLFNRVIDHTIQVYSDLFGNLASSGDLVDDEMLASHGVPLTPEDLLKLLKGGGVMVASVNSERPAGPIAPLEFKDVTTLADRLQERIIGQNEAVTAVAEGMVVPAAGLNEPTKPIRSFLFLGPTGVGKTQLALTLAEELSPEPLNVVRIDMSEYQKSHEVAKLFGSPPGYVGHEEGGVLTKSVSENPRSVVILDEIEKAHPKVWDTLLQVLDAGRMADSTGKVIDFTQTVVIMTSNVGVAELNRKDIGFITKTSAEQYLERQKNAKVTVMKEVEKIFRPEFINRIDDIVVFKEISEEIASKIIRRELSVVYDRVEERGYSINAISDELVSALLSKSDISKYGAREIQRVILKNVSNQLAYFIVKNSSVKNLAVQVENDEILVLKD